MTGIESVQEYARDMASIVDQRVTDLANARYFTQGQGLHKLLKSRGVVRKHILAVGLVDV